MPDFAAIADDLFTQGWSLQPTFLAAPAVLALRDEVEQAREQLQPAGVGRAAARVQDAAVRSDQIQWLDREGGMAQAAFLARMEGLRLALNQRLQLGLFDYEAHFARYAPGSFYQRHVDAFQAADHDAGRDVRPRRILSSVTYLNADWEPADGGELVVWDGAGREVLKLMPQAGLAVFFMSDEFPHEVLAAGRERLSIAGWFRSRGS